MRDPISCFIMPKNSNVASLRTLLHSLRSETKRGHLQSDKSYRYRQKKSFLWNITAEPRRWARFKFAFSCWDEKLDATFYSEGYLWRTIFLTHWYHDPRDVAKEITVIDRECALITERYSVNSRVLAAGGVEGDVNRQYGVIRVANRAKLRCVTINRDGSKTDRELNRYRQVYWGNV